jgi:hypothetical protein
VTELILMVTIPPLVGVLTYAAVRWRWARQERVKPMTVREPRLN